MEKTYKEISDTEMKALLAIVSVLLIGCSLAWLYPFCCILSYGTHTVNEPVRWILISEVVLFFTCFSFGVLGVLIVIRSKP